MELRLPFNNLISVGEVEVTTQKINELLKVLSVGLILDDSFDVSMKSQMATIL